MRRHLVLSILGAAALSGCATTSRTIAVADPVPPSQPVATIAMPAGGYPGMVIPAALPDGSYPTPNRGLSSEATLWHMRVALNVAALACRGTDGPRIVAAYNMMLTSRKTVLKTAEADYAGEYQAKGGDWRDSYDDAMTRLYNFFSQSPARDRFCATAAQVLNASATVSDADLPAFARSGLDQLDAPFTDFYRAYDAWRSQRVAPMLIAAASAAPAIGTALAPAPAIIALSAPAPTAIRPVSPAAPRLEVDAGIFRMEEKPLS